MHLRDPSQGPPAVDSPVFLRRFNRKAAGAAEKGFHRSLRALGHWIQSPARQGRPPPHSWTLNPSLTQASKPSAFANVASALPSGPRTRPRRRRAHRGRKLHAAECWQEGPQLSRVSFRGVHEPSHGGSCGHGASPAACRCPGVGRGSAGSSASGGRCERSSCPWRCKHLDSGNSLGLGEARTSRAPPLSVCVFPGMGY